MAVSQSAEALVIGRVTLTALRGGRMRILPGLAFGIATRWRSGVRCDSLNQDSQDAMGRAPQI